jgi:hypothetical protein
MVTVSSKNSWFALTGIVMATAINIVIKEKKAARKPLNGG